MKKEEILARNISLIRDFIRDIEIRMNEGNIKYMVSDLERLIRLENDLLEGKDSSQDIKIIINDKIIDLNE